MFHIERGDLLDVLEHPNKSRYGGQRIFVVDRRLNIRLKDAIRCALVAKPMTDAERGRGDRAGHPPQFLERMP